MAEGRTDIAAYILARIRYKLNGSPVISSQGAGGALPADLESRLRCYQLHIGLDAMTYNAFTGRFDELARNAGQTMALI